LGGMVDPATTEALLKVAEMTAAGAAGKKIIEAVLVPPAQKVGVVLGRLTDTVLAPLRAMAWGFERIEEWIEKEVGMRLEGVPAERIQTPEPEIAVPALMAVAYTRSEELRAMFASLIARSMDSATAGDVHPSFVEVIKQLAPGEARMLAILANPRYTAHFYSLAPHEHMVSRDEEILFPGVSDVTDLFALAGCRPDARAMVSVGNLERLNLVRFSGAETIGLPANQVPLEHFPPQARGPLERIMALTVPMFDHRTLDLTAFGRNFCHCCVDEFSTASPET